MRFLLIVVKSIILCLLTFCISQESINLFPISFNENFKTVRIKGTNNRGNEKYTISNTTTSQTKGENQCFRYTNCYECSSRNECYWCNQTGTCDNYNSSACSIDLIKYVQNVEISDLWFYNFYYMCPPISKCGKIVYDILSDKVSINLSQNLNIYDGCYWIIQNSNLKNYSFSLDRMGLGRDKVAFANILTSNTYTYEFDEEIDTSIKNKVENFYKKIIFYQYFDKPLKNSFQMLINLKIEEESNSLLRVCVIIICTLMSALICLIILRCILVHCCFRVSVSIDDTIDRLQPEIALEIQDEKIEEIISHFKESSFEECKMTDQINCTVCLLPNEGKENIISLPCHHYFHFNCITNWVRRKNIKPTCPNCNYDLLSNKSVPIPSGFLKDKENNKNLSKPENNIVSNTLDDQSRSHTDITNEVNKNNFVKGKDIPIDSSSNEFQDDLSSTHNKLIVNPKNNPSVK